MDDNTLEQRIRYLVEHGGVWEDPLEDIRRGVRWAIGLGGLAVLGELALYLIR